ncbi:NADH:flavin oxidoreductase [Halieaceae bacterium IMCC14734]|uniref:NADH:flavin oxidoreductase n=1 Tax=Candidatus Litorirhabdus singularis TaxID=2518993 RepID=A0ABT3TF22_9GAMM|nr:NADH:flavin oxidoreductase [Candidatus Litorirhabdus singularis]MCX2980907.1 NADH:flavin oxidoreductase [Candidatus Litorirhabdus singularis]
MSQNLQRAFQPAMLGKLELRNRLIKAGTFEGKTPDGVPGDQLLNFHLGIAEGGIGMTTLAYCATESDGRLNDQMMFMHEGIRPQLTATLQKLQATGARVSGQMAHCGNFSKNRNLTRLKRPMGPSRQINMLGLPAGMPFAGAMTHPQIDEMVQTFYDAGVFMKSVGFDAIELHMGHGYGLSQFISPRTNKRNDEYGGSLVNRMRLPLRALEAVRKAVGDDFPVVAKISLMDGVRDGLQQNESVESAGMLDEAGIDGVITSGGTSSMNVMKMFRGPSIVHGMIEQEKNIIMKTGLKIMGPKMFRNYPYEELYFMEGAQQVRDRMKNAKLIYIGGCSTMESFEKVMSAGVDFVQLGRPLLADPAYANNAKAALDAGKSYRSGCTHCNRCVALIDSPGGIRCPELHGDESGRMN